MSILKEKLFALLHIVDLVFFALKKRVYKIRESRGIIRPGGNGKKMILSHVTYYAGANAGDIALSQCVRREFEKKYTQVNWNIINVRESVDDKKIDTINSSQALVIGGGGLFLPDSNPNLVSGWQWAISSEQLQKIKVPMLIYSVGYNYFRGQESTELFQKNLIALCEKVKFIGLRNTGSIEAVKNIIPEKLHEKVMFQPCTTTVIRKIYGNAIPKKVTSKKVAFNLAFDREKRRFGENMEKILVEIAKAAKMIEERGYEIVLVYHVWNDQRIKPYMDSIGVKYKEKDLSSSFPKDIYKFYNGIEFVIGMRGHSQMIPFGLNCEILSLVTHEKMRWFLEDIDAVDWQIDLMEGESELATRILESFVRIHETEHELTQKRLYEEQEKLWKVTQKNMHIINEIVVGTRQGK